MFEMTKRETICIDGCIVDEIQKLWDNKVYTLGCCCGHGKNRPSVVIDSILDAKITQKLLGDGWDVLVWASCRYDDGKLIKFK